MFQYLRYCPLLLIGLLTAVSGITAQRLDRGSRAAQAAAGENLADVPTHFGEWEMQATHELSTHDSEMLQCAGSLHRTYWHRSRGQTVNVLIIVGPPGPTSVHNPEICYSSKGFVAAEEAQRILIDCDRAAQHAFWKLTLRAGASAEEQLDVAYAWSSGGNWIAPVYPRFAFGGKPLLYKMQLATSHSNQADDVCRRFLQDLLPVLDTTLFPVSAGE